MFADYPGCFAGVNCLNDERLNFRMNGKPDSGVSGIEHSILRTKVAITYRPDEKHMGTIHFGKQCAGKSHVRFDERAAARLFSTLYATFHHEAVRQSRIVFLA